MGSGEGRGREREIEKERERKGERGRERMERESMCVHGGENNNKKFILQVKHYITKDRELIKIKSLHNKSQIYKYMYTTQYCHPWASFLGDKK